MRSIGVGGRTTARGATRRAAALFCPGGRLRGAAVRPACDAADAPRVLLLEDDFDG
jgi:hypothetical protein